jgi:hypothetical protein
MSSQTEFFPSFPVDVGALWSMSGKSMDYAEKAYRAWLDAAGEIRGETMAFFNERLAKDSDALTRLGRCRTPIEVLNLQAEYAGNAFADLVDEGRKIATCLNKAAWAGAASEAVNEPASGHKPHARRTTGH